MRQTRWLPAALWPAGLAAVVIGFVLLFREDGDVTAIALVNRAVGGSFIFCGLIAWHRRPGNRTGALMTVTGFFFLAEPLLVAIGSPLTDSLAELTANWWSVPFAALVLSFPSGRLSTRVDRAIVWGFVFGAGVLQLVWLWFLDFPGNVFLITADAGVADAIDTAQRAINGTLAAALGLVGIVRFVRAAPPLRRLLLPTLAGALTALIFAVQILYQVVTGEFIRTSQEVTAVVLVSVPLAFLFGLLRAQFARAGMADLVVALQLAPDSARLGALLSKALRDPSLDLVYWLPRVRALRRRQWPARRPTGAGFGPCRDPGRSRRRARGGPHPRRRADLRAAVARDRLRRRQRRARARTAARELQSRVEELAGSRARVVEAGDEARRRIERDLHDGAQQRLVSLAIQLRMTQDRVRDDPDTALKFVAAAREEVSKSLEELRELARGIHPAVLEYGLDTALDSLAERSPVPVAVSVELPDRLPDAVELAAYFVACEALANVGKYARASRVEIRVRRVEDLAVVEIADDGIGGADDALGSGLRGLADRVEALGGRLRIVSPPGGGTALTAEMPCAARPAAR